MLDIKNSKIYCMLQMIDPKHSIVLNEQIGLIGEYENNEYENKNTEVATLETIKNDKYKRGDFFRIIDEDGCILFDPYITLIGIIASGIKIIGYCFILKDIDEKDEKSLLPGIYMSDEPVVVYVDNKLYSKGIYKDKISTDVIVDDSIGIENLGSELYMLHFKDNDYISYRYTKKLNIFVFRIHN